MQQPKIPISAVDEILRAAEEAPSLHETELTKTEAMRRVVPALKAMQAKGYGLAQIARLLSDKGVAVTEVTLRHYMHRMGGRSVAETSRTPRRDRASERSATASPPKQASGARPALHGGSTAASTAERPDIHSPATSHPRGSDTTSSMPSELPRRATAPSATEPSAPQGGFVVRPDRPRI